MTSEKGDGSGVLLPGKDGGDHHNGAGGDHEDSLVSEGVGVDMLDEVLEVRVPRGRCGRGVGQSLAFRRRQVMTENLQARVEHSSADGDTKTAAEGASLSENSLGDGVFLSRFRLDARENGRRAKVETDAQSEDERESIRRSKVRLSVDDHKHETDTEDLRNRRDSHDESHLVRFGVHRSSNERSNCAGSKHRQ